MDGTPVGPFSSRGDLKRDRFASMVVLFAALPLGMGAAAAPGVLPATGIVGGLVAGSLAGCKPDEHTVRVAVQEFRFAPSTIRVPAGVPVRLTFVNEGREPHELAGSLVTGPGVRVLADTGNPRVLPGHSVTVLLQMPPGTYTFRCRIRGHAGMEGTLIVEG